MGHMGNRVLTTVLLGVGCLLSHTAAAQDIDLAVGGAGTIWNGTAAGARAGASFDQGPVSIGSGPGRRDLIIGAPGSPSLDGKVYILFGGTLPTGEVSLASAHTILNGAAAGDGFGTATAIGSITMTERPTDTYPKNLVVGAPGSLANRGIVYVYAGGFALGDVIDTSSAIVRIIGNTGDRLGSSLATADLDFDGYREIIIGAPAKGRIYVIKGGAGLSGTIDLSVTSAALKFEYEGLGVMLAAGDVTGDGIYDVVVGHPVANAVHVLKGRNGTLPPATFDMTFGGIDGGDRPGTTIRLPFLDNDDRIRDIVIGAPGGDGPGNSRTDAGEVYVLFGGAHLAGGSLAGADATFYGASANGQLGSLMASGDINRDTPNDIVMGAPGANSGAGRLYVYYGRLRSQIVGAWDFATVLPSRGVIGDPAAGGMGAVFVWEVTGEGARDVILGAPNRNGNGSVYFVISPRLDLATTGVSLSGFQGITTSSPIAVRNISNIPITWETRSDRPWLSGTPNGSTSATTPGDVNVFANGQGLRPGIYTGTLTVVSTSEHLEMTGTIDVTFEVRETQPTTASDPVGGFPPGNRYKLFWRHSTEGWLAFWHMNGVTVESTSSVSINRLTDTAWNVVGMGDLNGDGHKDLVWRHDGGGIAAWFLNGTVVVQTSYLSVPSADPLWKIRGVGDLDGDGRADLVFQNASTGDLAAWLMNGASVVGTRMLSVPRGAAGWVIQAVGDTNGDGRADLLWRKDTGDLAVWFMSGTTVIGTRMLSVPSVSDMNWSLVATEDVNGDGMSDLIWQHSSGAVATWLLNGHTVIGTQMTNPSAPINSAWRIGGPK